MHMIEPYFNWRNLYAAEEDERSPFYGREYSELYFSDAIYDHYIERRKQTQPHQVNPLVGGEGEAVEQPSSQSNGGQNEEQQPQPKDTPGLGL